MILYRGYSDRQSSYNVALVSVYSFIVYLFLFDVAILNMECTLIAGATAAQWRLIAPRLAMTSRWFMMIHKGGSYE